MTVDQVRLDHPLVVGSGVAGLSVALGLPVATVLTTGRAGSTALAQGGIAVALDESDSPHDHAADTIAVGGGLNLPAAVDILTRGGPEAVRHLLELGARLDRDHDGDLELGREAGHRRRRVVHADGDATGAEVQRTLDQAAAAHDGLAVATGWRLLDLLRDDEGVTGVLAVDDHGRRVAWSAPAVVLATGGIGRLYRHTTNPEGVTGAGLAAAARAGVRLADLEFVQFHPTALLADLDPMPLLTEALRGEGAVLVDETGNRFMVGVHPDAELAPRDVVARTTWQHRMAGHETFLDARHVPDLNAHFPTVHALARRVGLDPSTDLLPVSPAAHYHMGGIAVDPDGASSMPGLWAVGEVSSTGVHGANRLASNSLLEGLVFGAWVARSVRARPIGHRSRPGDDLPAWTTGLHELPLEPGPEVDRVRDLMWRHAGVVRSRHGLELADARLDAWRDALGRSVPGLVAHTVASLVVNAALARTESRGGHHRSDHPHPDPTQARRSPVEPIPVPAVAGALASPTGVGVGARTRVTA